MRQANRPGLIALTPLLSAPGCHLGYSMIGVVEGSIAETVERSVCQLEARAEGEAVEAITCLTQCPARRL